MDNCAVKNIQSNPQDSTAKEFCTPIEIDAGWILDPCSVLISAKQLAVSCTRNVFLKIYTGSFRHQYEIHYLIQPIQGSTSSKVMEVRVALVTTNIPKG